MIDEIRQEVVQVADAWDRAMVTNDPQAIGEFMADDWTSVGSNGSVTDKATFLELVRSGKLTHDRMESHDLEPRIYGETAVVLARESPVERSRASAFISWSG